MSWSVVRDLGPLGIRIDSTHRSRLAASFFAAISRGDVVVHQTAHAKELQKRRDEVWVPVFGPEGETRWIQA